jgi:zinc protease
VSALLWALGAQAAPRSSPLPAPLPSPAWSPPVPAISRLSSGLPVWVLPRRASETFDLALVLEVGEHQDPAGLQGLCQVTLDLADEGAGNLSAAAFDAAVRALGAEISASCSGDTATLRLRGLRRNLEPALDLWALAIRQPGGAEPDLALVVQRHIDRVKVRLKEPAGVADRVQAAAEYGTSYLGRSPTEASLGALTGDHVRTFWTEHVGPSVAAVVAGGDLRAAELLPLLEARLGSWTPAQPAAPAPEIALREVEREEIFVADLPRAPQSAIRAFVPLPAGTTPSERAALDVAIEVLGASFTSRVNRNLREDKGWTYGARCRPSYREGHGFLECSTLVRADVTAEAVAELRRELREVVGERPITDAELPVYREGLLRSWLTEHETTSALLGEAMGAWRRDLPADWAARYLSAVEAVDRGAASRALAAHLVPDEVTWVVVGDLAQIREPLAALGLPLQETRP